MSAQLGAITHAKGLIFIAPAFSSSPFSYMKARRTGVISHSHHDHCHVRKPYLERAVGHPGKMPIFAKTLRPSRLQSNHDIDNIKAKI